MGYQIFDTKIGENMKKIIDKNEDINLVNSNFETTWYKLSNEEVVKRLETSKVNGLTKDQVANRLEKYGKNILPQSKKPNIIKIFLKTFIEPLSAMLIIAGLVSLTIAIIANEFSAPDITGLVIIFLIVITNSIIITIQELKAFSYISSLDSKNQVKIEVLRDGKKQNINIDELVIGDIVFVKSGQFVPADIRIIEDISLKIDESAITGENEPSLKTSQLILKDNLALGDQKNIAFMSTLILEGKMLGIVLKTGKNSEVGKIATKITNSKPIKTALEEKIIKLTTIIGLISIAIGLLLFLLLFFMEGSTEEFNSLNKMLLVCISAAISVIPESLTIIVKICLTIASKKMLKNNVIVKNPKSIETLGNVNVICSDKTGTLTQNKMAVTNLLLNFKQVDLQDFNSKQNSEFINCISLCSDTNLSKDQSGNPTEKASLKFLVDKQINYLDIRKKFKRIDEIPFDSKRKMMTTVNQDSKIKKVYSKGAIDYLISKCEYKLVDNKVSLLTKADKEKIEQLYLNFAKQGLRVLGLAYKDFDNKEYEQELIFIGAIGIIDPPRPEVKQSIIDAHNAGIRVIMITGDHKLTAYQIATELGITSNQFNNVLTGTEIDQLSKEQLKYKIKTTNVFARVNPEHKAIIVDLLQEEKNIVAMTGDGVNDSPSIVKADIGIAMGISGSEVTKEISDVILKDDNFKSIINGIRSGRNVYEKIKYSISFLLAANISQVLTILLILIMNKDLALNSVNILFHIFVVETIVAIPIGMQADRKNIMKNLPPNSRKESLLKGLIFQIIIVTIITSLISVLNYEIAHIFYCDINIAQEFGKTGVYITIIVSPIIYSLMFNNYFLPINLVKTNFKEKIKLNKYLLLFSLIALILTIITLLPFEQLNKFFDFSTKNMNIWLLIIFILNTLLVPVLIYLSYKIFCVVIVKRNYVIKKIA